MIPTNVENFVCFKPRDRDAILAILGGADHEDAARRTGLPPEQVRAVYAEFQKFLSEAMVNAAKQYVSLALGSSPSNNTDHTVSEIIAEIGWQKMEDYDDTGPDCAKKQEAKRKRQEMEQKMDMAGALAASPRHSLNDMLIEIGLPDPDLVPRNDADRPRVEAEKARRATEREGITGKFRMRILERVGLRDPEMVPHNDFDRPCKKVHYREMPGIEPEFILTIENGRGIIRKAGKVWFDGTPEKGVEYLKKLEAAPTSPVVIFTTAMRKILGESKGLTDAQRLELGDILTELAATYEGMTPEEMREAFEREIREWADDQKTATEDAKPETPNQSDMERASCCKPTITTSTASPPLNEQTS